LAEGVADRVELADPVPRAGEQVAHRLVVLAELRGERAEQLGVELDFLGRGGGSAGLRFCDHIGFATKKHESSPLRRFARRGRGRITVKRSYTGGKRDVNGPGRRVNAEADWYPAPVRVAMRSERRNQRDAGRQQEPQDHLAEGRVVELAV